jgi:hypothetical protein
MPLTAHHVPRPETPTAERGSRLLAPTAGLRAILWAELTIEQRQVFLVTTEEQYSKLLNEMIDTSNICVERFGRFMRNHGAWRWTVIIGTGMIAVLNILASGMTGSSKSTGLWGIGASAFGVVITILATLEGFTNSAQRAQAFRESREMFLDTSRVYAAAWHNFVIPLSDTPEACENAAELHRRLIQADCELRSRFKDLTMTRQEHGGGSGK